MKKNNKAKNTNIQQQSKKTCFNVTDSGINFILSLIIPMVAALVLIFLFAMFSRMAGSNYAEFSKTNVALIISLIYTPMVFFCIYYVYCKVFNYNCFKASDIIFKLNFQKVLTVVVISLVSVFLISPFIGLLDYAYGLMGYSPENSLPYVMDNGFRYVLGVIVMAIIPAICEELLFRGLIQKGLMSKFNPHIAILLSATMFMLLHGSLQQTVFQFILGVALGYVCYYGGSLLYSMIMHFVNNFVVVTISFVYTLNNVDVNTPTVYKNAWDYCMPILLFIVAVAIIVGLVFLLKYFDKIQKDNKNLENTTESNEEINNINNTEEIVVEENKKELSTKAKLTKNELMWLISGFVLGVVIWISNTFIGFY